jgi:glycogen(starch) synthase
MKLPLKVAVVAHGFLPLVGGEEVHHALGAKTLEGVAEVEIFTADLVLRDAGVQRGTQEAEIPTRGYPFVVHYLPSIRIQGEKMVRPLPLWRALHRFKPDVVWTSNPSPTADLAAMYALVTGARWVATYHADLALGSWTRLLFQQFETRLLRRASQIEVSSPHYAVKLHSRGIRSGQTVVILPYSDLSIQHSEDVIPETVKTNAIPGRDHPFLFVGALDHGHAYKRPEYLLEQVAELRHEGVKAHLNLIGDGGRKRELELLAERLGLDDAVKFLGQVSDLELRKQYQDAWALVMPADSDTEGFGLVALEAIRAGCPVVVSSRTPMGELLQGSGAGFVWDSTDPNGLERVLKRVWSEPGIRLRASRSAQKFPHRSWMDIRTQTIQMVLGLDWPKNPRPESPSGPGQAES